MTSFYLNGPQKWSQKVAKQVALANLPICMCTKEIYNTKELNNTDENEEIYKKNTDENTDEYYVMKYTYQYYAIKFLYEFYKTTFYR